MSNYSIGDIEMLSGVKAHTIRIWEQRYGLVIPNRTDTNIRYYTDEHLRDLLNIALLNKQGVKISKIAKLNKSQITEKVTEITQNEPSSNTQIDGLTLATVQMNELDAETILNRHFAEHGFELTMYQLIYPFLDKLNVLWLTGSIQPAHERFISHLIKRKIILAIEKNSIQPEKQSPTFLLYLREGESQELTLLFMHYLLRARGFRVVNLGIHATLADISTASQCTKPDFVFSIFNEPLHRQSFQSYLDGLAKSTNDSKVLITGQQIFSQYLHLPAHFQTLNGLEDTLVFLDQLATS